jgi:hypothetical protein
MFGDSRIIQSTIIAELVCVERPLAVAQLRTGSRLFSHSISSGIKITNPRVASHAATAVLSESKKF